MSNEPMSGALLLALDLQPGFLAAIPGQDELLKRCRLALAAAAGLGLPVAFTEQVPAKLGRTDASLLAAAPGAKVFAKTAFSALEDEAVLAAVRDGGVEHLILCGIETPVCIYQTALSALGEGLQVTVLTDAIGARRADDAAVCLRAMAAAGVHLLPVETVCYALLHDAAHPFFKPFTQLVKSHA